MWCEHSPMASCHHQWHIAESRVLGRDAHDLPSQASMSHKDPSNASPIPSQKEGTHIESTQGDRHQGIKGRAEPLTKCSVLCPILMHIVLHTAQEPSFYILKLCVCPCMCVNVYMLVCMHVHKCVTCVCMHSQPISIFLWYSSVMNAHLTCPKRAPSSFCLSSDVSSSEGLRVLCTFSPSSQSPAHFVPGITLAPGIQRRADSCCFKVGCMALPPAGCV